MTTRSDYHTDTASEFLSKARAHLAEGDLLQASANGWRAAEQMVEAVAESRGWRHSSHGDLHRAVRRLAEGSSDQRLQRRFRSANALHENFYEGWMTEETVAAGIHDVEQFAAALESYLP